MNFTSYIQRQKNIIRSRHDGETFLLQRGEVIALNRTDKLLSELSRMKGLNVRERVRARQA